MGCSADKAVSELENTRKQLRTLEALNEQAQIKLLHSRHSLELFIGIHSSALEKLKVMEQRLLLLEDHYNPALLPKFN